MLESHPFDSAVESFSRYSMQCDKDLLPNDVITATSIESLPPAYAVLAIVGLSNFVNPSFDLDVSNPKDIRYLQIATDHIELQRGSLIDSVTGYMNRDGLYRWAKLHYDPTNTRYAIFAVDLKKFKAVNDVLGHPKGDEALKIAAELISSQIRAPRPSSFFVGSVDVRQHDTFDVLSVARTGGDEFTFVMNLNGLSIAEANEVISRVSDYLTGKNITVVSNDGRLQKDFGFKVGYTMTGPDNPLNFEDAIVTADTDLINKYLAPPKKHGLTASIVEKYFKIKTTEDR